MDANGELSREKQKYDPLHFRGKGDEFLGRLEMSRSLQTGYNIGDKKVVLKNDSYYPQYETIGMDPIYDTEEILYLTKKGLENRQVFIVDDLVYRSDLTHYASNSRLQADNGMGDMIVMDELGNTFIYPKQRGIIHHSSFFSGSPLSFAGLANVVDGTIYNLVVHSGHYRPTYTELCQFQSESDRISLQVFDTRDIKISLDHTVKELIDAIHCEIGIGLNSFTRANIIHGGQAVSLEKRLCELRMQEGTIFFYCSPSLDGTNLYKKRRISVI